METEKNRFAMLREALIPPIPAPSSAPRELEAGGRVLFALFTSDLPPEGLQTALAIADLFESELHVLCVLPPFDRISALAPSINQLLRALDHRVEVEHATRVWLQAGLGFAMAEQRLKVRYGDAVQETAAHARDLKASMIVVAPGSGGFGNKVTALACAAEVPVLVARDRMQTELIVAATDLQDRTFPVLRRAAELGNRLNASVVAMHNVGAPTPDPDSVSPRLAQVSDACARRLREASQSLEIDADVVVSRELSSAEAILREARMRNVDLIVVGTRPRSRLERWTTGSVASRIVTGAQGSVLVTPLEAAVRRRHERRRHDAPERGAH